MKHPKKPMIFDCFDPDCGAALIIAIAEAMSAGLDTDQMNVLGSFLNAVADTISYISVQTSYNKEICSLKEDLESKDKKSTGGSSKEELSGADKTGDTKNESGVERAENKTYATDNKTI